MLSDVLKQGVWEGGACWVQFSFDWDFVSADGAAHVLCQVPSGNLEAVSFDYKFVAVWAISVFGWMPRGVSDICVV